MDASATAPPATGPATGSATIADLIPLAAAAHGDHVAVRHKRDGVWHDVTYVELDEIVREIALGLIDLGVPAGEPLCILAGTRPEWSYVDMAATQIGAIVVPIYQTNSPEECEWVISDSHARAIVCENAEQLAKVQQIRARVPQLRTVIVMDPPAEPSPLEPIALEEVRRRGRQRDRAELDARLAAVRPDDPFTYIYTSGTTGPPKGCVLSHGNYRSIIEMIRHVGQITDDEVVYLYLPLAHSFALLVQLATFNLGGTIAYFGGDTTQIVAELMEVKPTYLPSVPRIFEKVYTLAQAAIAAQSPEEQAQAAAAVELGMTVRQMMARHEAVPEELRAPFEQADRQLFANVRAIFGGEVRHATSGAAPIAREILEFFWACGVPVLEGYGMTETATAATVCTLEKFKFGTVGQPLP
ncbi:MAG: AMP-binding protein, partial [Solirubrobacterales bacterium]|nr:AMP-binding protein [Solirubrobacterales bacterium]